MNDEDKRNQEFDTENEPIASEPYRGTSQSKRKKERG